MKPDDLGRLRLPSDPRLAPDGRAVAFVVTCIDLEEDRYNHQIWLWDGEEAAPFTAGRADTSPRWSPDGEWLAFLRKGTGDDDQPQVALMPRSGGEAQVVTDFALGARELEWSPTEGKLAVVGVSYTDEWAELDDEERGRRPKRITELPYRGDGAGWTFDRRSHVYVLDVATTTLDQLTDGPYDDGGVVWRPDGAAVAFLSARHDRRGLDPAAQAWEVGLDGGEPRPLSEPAGFGLLSYAPDGTFYGLGEPDTQALPSVGSMYQRQADGGYRDMLPDLDRSILFYSPPVAPAGPQWLDDGGFVTLLENEGRVEAIRVGPDWQVEPFVGGDRVLTGITVNDDASAAAFVASTATDPGELWWHEAGVERRLTVLNDEFVAEAGLVAPEEFRVEVDGTDVHGWVYLPQRDGDVPLLLNIHGGPATQYGFGFFDEFQVYVGAGYGVVAINPRGSSGYGDEHMRAVVDEWPTEMPPDLRDFVTAVDAALERFPRLDRDRMGVMGGSYGGLATIRLLAVDGRFSSAVAERGLYSWTSFNGTSDIGTYFGEWYLGSLDDHERMWRASPLAYADDIDTPTLVIHSEADYRTPIEQGEQLFTLLMRRGVPTEMLRFPGEGHELSRSGTPTHRVERFEAILEWHARHLKT